LEKETNSFIEGKAEDFVDKMLLKTYYSFELCLASAKITELETKLAKTQ